MSHRVGIAAMAAGIVAAGTLALPVASASAATGDVTITVRLTMKVEGLRNPGAALTWTTPRSWPWVAGRMCHHLSTGQTQDFAVTVPKGTVFRIGYSEGCPAYTVRGRYVPVTADHEGQLVELDLVDH
ncbi:MAG TPA: hypothetical protein VI248_22620 [Kineosporiaceae bacterium]